MSDIEVEQILYNSQICRLCGEENLNGTNLYGNEDDEIDISLLINRYLPIKVNVFIKNVMTLTFSCCVERVLLKIFFSFNFLRLLMMEIIPAGYALDVILTLNRLYNFLI